MPVKILELIRISPSLRSLRGFLHLLQLVLRNLWHEWRFSFYGVRDLEHYQHVPRFLDLLGHVGTRTYLEPNRLFMLFQCVDQCQSLSGQMAEVGVYKGGSAIVIAAGIARSGRDKKLYLCDTYCGMPNVADAVDRYQTADLNDTSLALVKDGLWGYANVHFIEGEFSETCATLPNERYCFVHIDCDLKHSVAAACHYFYLRLVPGGIVLFDDYGFASCAGAREAVDEFFKTKEETPLVLASGQCMVIRIGKS